jgi:DNA repair protein RadC
MLFMQGCSIFHAIRNEALRGIGWRRRARQTEWLGFVPVSSRGRPGRLNIVAEGGARRVSVEPDYFFSRIVKSRASALILVHNHPSGTLEPSIEDLILTQRMERACERLGVLMLGHAVVTVREEKWIVL